MQTPSGPAYINRKDSYNHIVVTAMLDRVEGSSTVDAPVETFEPVL